MGRFPETEIDPTFLEEWWGNHYDRVLATALACTLDRCSICCKYLQWYCLWVDLLFVADDR